MTERLLNPSQRHVPQQLDLRFAVTVKAGALGRQKKLHRVNCGEIARKGYDHYNRRERVRLIVRDDDRRTKVVDLIRTSGGKIDEHKVAPP